MRKQRLPASLKSKIEFVMRGGRLDKRVKHRKKKHAVPAVSNLNFAIDQMSLKEHQNMSKKYYRLSIHILLPLTSLRLFPLPFYCQFYSASNMRIPVMIRLKFHEQCAEVSGKTVLVSHVPRNKFHNLCSESIISSMIYLAIVCDENTSSHAMHTRKQEAQGKRSLRSHQHNFQTEGRCVDTPLVTTQGAHLNRRADLGNSDWCYDARLCRCVSDKQVLK